MHLPLFEKGLGSLYIRMYIYIAYGFVNINFDQVD